MFSCVHYICNTINVIGRTSSLLIDVLYRLLVILKMVMGHYYYYHHCCPDDSDCDW